MGWHTSNNENEVKLEDEGVEDKEMKIKRLQDELSRSKMTIDEMQREIDVLHKNINQLKNKVQPQNLYESSHGGDIDDISTTPSLKRIEEMGKGVKSVEDLMRMEVNLMMRNEEIKVREEELLAKQEELNRKEAQLRLLEEEQGIISSQQIPAKDTKSSILSTNTYLDFSSKEADLQRRQ